MKRTLVIILFLAFGVSSCFYTNSRSRKLFKLAKSQPPLDAVIVPGIPFDGKNWNRIMKARVYWAVHLYKKGITKRIIFSGGAIYTPYTEAVVMGLYALKLGVPEEAIVYEKRAEHSVENLYYSYKIAQKQGWTQIAVASDPFQAKGLMPFVQKYKLNISALPIVFDTLKVIAKEDPVIDPTSAKVESFVSITDRQNFIERMQGTFGDDIIWEDGDGK